jgi:hypothetical protein
MVWTLVNHKRAHKGEGWSGMSSQKIYEKGEEITHSVHGLGQMLADLKDGRVFAKFYGDSEDEDKEIIVAVDELCVVEDMNVNETTATIPNEPPAANNPPALPPLSNFEKRAALLVERGIVTVPVVVGDKACKMTGWQELATTDGGQVKAWGQQYPEANTAAVAKSQLGGKLFLEFDHPKSRGHFENETELKVKDIVTMKVRSRKNRGYLVFNHTADSIAIGKFLNTKPKNTEMGIDEEGEFLSIRAHNAYMVGPGSIVNDGFHPDPYEIVDASPIADVPTALLEYAANHHKGKYRNCFAPASPTAKTSTVSREPTRAAQDWTENQTEGIRSRVQSDEIFMKGERNDTLSKYCYLRWVVEGCTKNELETDAKEFNQERINPPLPPEEVAATVNGKLRLAQLEPELRIAGDVVEKIRTAPVYVTPPLPTATRFAKNDEEYKQIVAANAQQTMADLQKTYDEADLEAEPVDEKEANPYPMEAWEGTPIKQFADIAGEKNNIPREYFANALLTLVGSICSKRIKAKHNSKQLVNFYTLLLSEDGGAGKNTATDWAADTFPKKTELVRKPAGAEAGTGLVGKVKNVGTYMSSFASERGALNVFAKNDCVLQVYSEFTTLLEKTGINGSGAAFKDTIMNLYDAPTIVWSEFAGTKLPKTLPDAVYNSIMASTTKDKWDEAGGMTADKTFIERLNIISVGKVKPVGILDYPEEQLKEVRKTLLARIGWLETRTMVWKFSPEAETTFKVWWGEVSTRREEDQEAGETGVTEAYGRINTYCLRVIGHLALWLSATPEVLKTLTQNQLPDGALPQVFDEVTGEVAEFGDDKPENLTWEVTVTPEIVQRAIRVAEYQIKARKQNIPAELDGADSYCENRVIKWMLKLRSTTFGILYKRANLSKWGMSRASRALDNIRRMGYLKVIADPRNPDRLADHKIVWVGDGTKTHKWDDHRGGKREGAGRRSPAFQPT